ncbi:hypothetical protein ABPG75_011313 [Micractinium tetrahymenae]
MTSAAHKQTHIEDFMSPRRRSTGQPSTKATAAAAVPTAPPAEPPVEEVLGRPVLKDFVDEHTKQVRPFKGYVRRRFKSDGSYLVVYEDGDREDLDWKGLWPLIKRAEGAGLSLHDPRTGKVAGKPAAAGRGKNEAAGTASGRSRGAASPAAAAAARAGAPSGSGERSQQLAAPPAAAEQEAAAPKQQVRPPKQQQEKQQSGDAPASAATAAAGLQKAGKQPKQPGSVAAAAAASTMQPKKQGKQQAGEGSSGGAAGKKRKQVGDAGSSGGSDGINKPKMKRQRAPSGPSVELPEPQMGEQHVYEYKRGEEPWRTAAGFTWQVNDEADVGVEATKRIRSLQRQFNKLLIQAKPEEEERVAKDRKFLEEKGLLGNREAAARKLKKLSAKERAELEARGLLTDRGLKLPSTRADRVVESRFKKWLKQQGSGEADGDQSGDSDGEDGDGASPEGQAKGDSQTDSKKVAGHFPGWPVGSRAYSRAELACLGFHFPPVAGIDFLQAGKAGKGAPSFATSVMVSGWYQDDKDDGTQMWYTGEGGNALLSERKQVKDQQLVRGNKALVGNIQLGIPVRVTRKQKDSGGAYGTAYIYDGLYDVVSYRYTKGIEGFGVYQYLLRRRPGQGKLLSQRVTWGGISAPRKMVPENRPGVVVLDITKGQDEKGIPAVDDTWLASEHDENQPQGDIPNCSALEDVVEESQLKGQIRGCNQKRLEQLAAQGHQPAVQYITQDEFVGKAAAAVAGLRQAELPPEHASTPHDYLKKLNHGQLPYNNAGQLFGARPAVYECGPWAGCPKGKDCPQAVSQHGIRFRLELFKTSTGCGWGVRSWDMIPQHSFICLYVAQIYDAEEHERLVREVEEQDAEYTFDLVPRPDVKWDGSEIPEEEREEERPVHFVACGLRKRNIGAWFNHSCAPNCFVQPLLDCHHDERCPKIAIFAWDNIPPMTELTIDYGEEYAKGFQGGCKCGAPECTSKRA